MKWLSGRGVIFSIVSNKKYRRQDKLLPFSILCNSIIDVTECKKTNRKVGRHEHRRILSCIHR